MSYDTITFLWKFYLNPEILQIIIIDTSHNVGSYTSHNTKPVSLPNSDIVKIYKDEQLDTDIQRSYSDIYMTTKIK